MEPCVKKILQHIASPLQRPDGTLVTDRSQWNEQREYIKKLLQENVYGTMPEMPDNIVILSESDEKLVYEGFASEKLYMLTADNIYGEFRFGLRIVRPVTDKKVPVLFMVLCDASKAGYQYELAEEIVKGHGYAVAMVDRIPAAPEIKDADIQLWTQKEYSYDPYMYYEIYKTRTQHFPDNALPLGEYMREYPYVFKYGKIALGAHCVRVAVSFVLGLGFADPDAIAVTGHSRDGKVALCAGVFDERIKAVIPQGSGCGGAALYKVPAKGLETIDDMVRMWPSWLPPLAKYRGRNEDALPLDMHFARACIAPRGVMNTEGMQDFWAGPFSAYVGKHASQSAFDLMGVPDKNGMFIRQGFHAMTREDILHTLMFCDYIFYGKKPEYDFANASYFQQ